MEPLLAPEVTKVLWDTRGNKVLPGMLLHLEGKQWPSEMLQKIPLWHHSAVHLHQREKKVQQFHHWELIKWDGTRKCFTPVHETQDIPSCSPIYPLLWNRMPTDINMDNMWQDFTHRKQDISCRLESILLKIWLNNREQSTHYVIFIRSQHKVCNFFTPML